MATEDKALRQQLIELLRGRNAHADFEQAIGGLPPKLRGVQPDGQPFTSWRLLEHLRIAQWDILEFSRNAKHVSPKWPEGYWPGEAGPPSAGAWTKSVATFRADLKAMQALVKNPKSDLLAPIPGGTGQNILREAMLLADHNAYHIGQLILLRRLLGAWKAD
jgi:hypothetical protein